MLRLQLRTCRHRRVRPDCHIVVKGPCTAAHLPPAGCSSHPGVSKVAFTGSVATGRRVNVAAAANLRPTSMELGGKSALIVFEDADVADAVEWAMFGCFWTSGQICTATSRLILHEKIAPSFHRLLKERAESISIGDPLDESSRMGPLVNASQHAKVMQYIEARLPQHHIKINFRRMREGQSRERVSETPYEEPEIQSSIGDVMR